MTFEELAKKLNLPYVPTHFAEAFTHRSYAVEHKLNYDNQRLEFLGDAVLELCISGWLYRHYTDYQEGDLTKIRSFMACEKTLATISKRLQLSSLLQTGRGEAAVNGQYRDSTAADLFEAVLGAIYLDFGFDFTKKIISDLGEDYLPNPSSVLENVNPKGKLQELTQAIWDEAPHYKVINVTGPDHSPEFLVEVSIKDTVALGNGSSRKKAEISAAASLYQLLSSKYPDYTKKK